MPGRDGTGPEGQGPLTGRRMKNRRSTVKQNQTNTNRSPRQAQRKMSGKGQGRRSI
ncbi:MAG: DUF5320 domain-containing protein [Bacteroidetes bacterium]|nr:DUF5320 domain-containing protein [Bacteroidota bacterium]